MATTSTSSTAVAEAVFSAFNAHDTGAQRKVWGPGVSERFPEATVSGADDLAAYFQELFDALPDVRMETLAIVEDGETVLVRWRLTGTHTGAPFQGINVTGKAVELDGFDQMTVRDGKLQQNFVVFDRMQFAQQLGLMPPDGSAPDRALKAAFNAGTSLKARIAARRSS